MSSPTCILAADIGNSRIKPGCFGAVGPGNALLPEPSSTLTLAPAEAGGAIDFGPLGPWLTASDMDPGCIAIASVSRPSTQGLLDHLRQLALEPTWQVRQLLGTDFPIANRTLYPERVGVDRLAAALAARKFQLDNNGLIVVDFGTAITVDLVDTSGAFAGGAILPGAALGARALHQGTDALPSTSPRLAGEAPAAVGRSTDEAIAAGLFWGAVGGVRELIARQGDRLATPPPVIVTGGIEPEFARLLGSTTYSVRYVPHLVLAGIALAVAENPLGEACR